MAVANPHLDDVQSISLGKLASTTLIAFALCIAALLLRRYLGQMSLVWHVNAFLVAVLISSPRRHWLPILVGGWVANLVGNLMFYPGSATAHLTPIFNTLEIWICAELPLRIMKGDLNLSRSKDLGVYTIFGAIGAPVIVPDFAEVACALFIVFSFVRPATLRSGRCPARIRTAQQKAPEGQSGAHGNR